MTHFEYLVFYRIFLLIFREQKELKFQFCGFLRSQPNPSVQYFLLRKLNLQSVINFHDGRLSW